MIGAVEGKRLERSSPTLGMCFTPLTSIVSFIFIIGKKDPNRVITLALKLFTSLIFLMLSAWKFETCNSLLLKNFIKAHLAKVPINVLFLSNFEKIQPNQNLYFSVCLKCTMAKNY